MGYHATNLGIKAVQIKALIDTEIPFLVQKTGNTLEQFAKRCSQWSEKILAKARRCNGVDRHPRLSKNAAMDKRFRSFASDRRSRKFSTPTPIHRLQI